MDFKTLPKVELHLHLDCSLSYQGSACYRPLRYRGRVSTWILSPLLNAQTWPIPDTLSQRFWLDANRRAAPPCHVRRVRTVAARHYALCGNTFCPLLHTQKGLSAEQVVEIVAEATAQASQDTGIEARLILCTLRHFNTEQSMQTVKLVERFPRHSRCRARPRG